MECPGVVRWCALVFLLALGLSTGAWGQSCPGYSFYTDTFGGRHYYLSTDPNETDLGPTCPANGGGTTPVVNNPGTTVSYAVQVTPTATFTATGLKSGSATVTVTNRNTGVAVAGAWVAWSPNSWTYRSPDGSTDAYGQYKLYFGHCRAVLVTLNVLVQDGQGGALLGSTTAGSQGVDSPSVYSAFNFYAPAAGKTYKCYGTNNASTDYVGVTFGWQTYKYTPLGFTVGVEGAFGSGIAWYEGNAPASGQNGTTFNCCQWDPLVSTPATGRLTGTLWAGYYTLNGNLDYAVVSGSSNAFTVVID